MLSPDRSSTHLDGATHQPASTHVAAGTPSSLMNLKLQPPNLPAACIERPALLAHVDAAAGRKLTVVAAPVGYGKSVLLTQWYTQACAARCVAWLSLDAQDNEPARFFMYLAGAIDKACAELPTLTGAQCREECAEERSSVDVLALRLAERLNSVQRAMSIVIDDFHQLHAPELARAFTFLVHRSPPHVRWILAGRSVPELACSELKLRDDVCIIDRQTLSLECAEILALSRELRCVPLSTEQAAGIHTHTEGWVTGVKLMLMARSAASTGDVSVPSPTAAVLEISRYLHATVLRQQTVQVRQFLLASSILEQVHGDLCNSLLGVGYGAVMLETLERAQLFLQPLDREPGWYRYHPLFHEFLRACLQRDHAERIPTLHLAASRWYAGQQRHEAALRHAFSSEDQAWCVELVGRCGKLWLRNGAITELVRWTRRLSREQILHHDVLATSYIACLILCRRFAEASAWLADIDRILRIASERSPYLRVRAQTLQLMLAVLSDGAHHIDLTVSAQLLEHCGGYLSGTLLTLQAYGLLRRCRFDQARRLALRARRTMLEQDNRYGVGNADILICLADSAQGDLESAAQVCQRMLEEAGHDQHDAAWANAATAMARMHYEQNQLSRAEALCTQAVPLLCTASSPEIFTVAHILLARLHALAGRRTDSFRLLDSLHSVLEGTGDHSWLGHVCYEKVRLQLSNGERQRAAATAADFGLPQLVAQGAWGQPRDYAASWERFGLVRAMLLLDAECFEPCRALLEVLASSARNAGFVSRTVALEALLAVCSWRCGDQAAAYAALNRGLELMPKTGFMRSVFDEAPGLPEVIGAALRNHRLRYPLPPGYLEMFADLFWAPSPQPRARALVEPLTERESEILQLLARGLSNQQMSNHLSISLATVKWHLRNVFAKLNAPTRTGALARARELRIIG